MSDLLRQISPDQVNRARRDPVDEETLSAAAAIVADVKNGGWESLIDHARRLGDLQEGEPILYGQSDLEAALASSSAPSVECAESAPSPGPSGQLCRT